MADRRAAALREEAGRVLRPLADLAAAVAPGADPPWEELVRVNEHAVASASACMASLAFEAPFDGWRAAFARRTLTTLTLERMRRGASLDPGALVRAVVDDEARTARTSLGQWLGSLGPGGVAAVVREATVEVVAARTELRRWPPAEGTRFGDVFHWHVPGRAVRLEATADAVTRPGGELLVFARRRDSDAGRRELAWLALVGALRAGIPASVTRIDLQTGRRRRVAVTDDVLDDGLTLAATAVEAAIAARYGAPAATTPGRWCRRCDGLVGCPPGGSWVMARTGHLDHGA